MNRIFGSSKPKPKASLSDAITSVRSFIRVLASGLCSCAWQTETRIGAIEVKIKKLDAELMKYKEQIAKLRNGPGKVRLASQSP